MVSRTATFARKVGRVSRRDDRGISRREPDYRAFRGRGIGSRRSVDYHSLSLNRSRLSVAFKCRWKSRRQDRRRASYSVTVYYPPDFVSPLRLSDSSRLSVVAPSVEPSAPARTCSRRNEIPHSLARASRAVSLSCPVSRLCRCRRRSRSSSGRRREERRLCTRVQRDGGCRERTACAVRVCLVSLCGKCARERKREKDKSKGPRRDATLRKTRLRTREDGE